MNARTQITLDPEMQRRAQAKAEELGISFAEYMRRLVAQDLGPAPRKADISVMFNFVDSDEPTDIAKNKHQMIAEAFWDEYLRATGQSSKRSVGVRVRRR